MRCYTRWLNAKQTSLSIDVYCFRAIEFVVFRSFKLPAGFLEHSTCWHSSHFTEYTVIVFKKEGMSSASTCFTSNCEEEFFHLFTAIAINKRHNTLSTCHVRTDDWNLQCGCGIFYTLATCGIPWYTYTKPWRVGIYLRFLLVSVHSPSGFRLSAQETIPCFLLRRVHNSNRLP